MELKQQMFMQGYSPCGAVIGEVLIAHRFPIGRILKGAREAGIRFFGVFIAGRRGH